MHFNPHCVVYALWHLYLLTKSRNLHGLHIREYIATYIQARAIIYSILEIECIYYRLSLSHLITIKNIPRNFSRWIIIQFEITRRLIILSWAERINERYKVADNLYIYTYIQRGSPSRRRKEELSIYIRERAASRFVGLDTLRSAAREFLLISGFLI